MLTKRHIIFTFLLTFARKANYNFDNLSYDKQNYHFHHKISSIHWNISDLPTTQPPYVLSYALLYLSPDASICMFQFHQLSMFQSYQLPNPMSQYHQLPNPTIPNTPNRHSHQPPIPPSRNSTNAQSHKILLIPNRSNIHQQFYQFPILPTFSLTNFQSQQLPILTTSNLNNF